MLVVVIIGQTNHGVGLRQVPTEGGTLGWLGRDRQYLKELFLITPYSPKRYLEPP